MDSIKYKGKTVSFRYFKEGKKFVEVRRRHGDVDMCPLCKKVFRKNDVGGIYLIVSNQAGVPNRFIHEECKKYDFFMTFDIIACDYQEALQYKDWFPTYD